MDYLKVVDPEAFVRGSFSRQVLAGIETGVSSVRIFAAVVPAGTAGPALHQHRYDQFYFVLQGQLSVEIDGQTLVAKPNTLVSLPRGVPHRQWNDGPDDEMQLAIESPETQEKQAPKT